jgi:threonine dehydrogenase-like Zn-dependent dehydrogenase
MKALYKYGPGEKEIELRELPVPAIRRDDDVLVKVARVALCGMDVHIYHGTFPCAPPFIMGHEFVGRVEKAGSAVSRLKPGDRVVAQPHHDACGICHACRSGLPQCCAERRSLGISKDGAMAEYIVVQDRYLHQVPDSVSDSIAAIIEPLSMIVDDLARVGLAEHDTVAIIGAGQIAQLAVVAANAAKASLIVVVGAARDVPTHFPAAKALGADAALALGRDDVEAEIGRLTNGRGVDLVIEASGSEQGIETAIRVARIGGKLSLLGLTRKDHVPVAWDSLLKKRLSLHFNWMSDYSAMDETIAICANPPCRLDPLVTRVAPLEAWQSVFEEQTIGLGIKAVLTIDANEAGER